jgi:bacterioferritin-associated ferredoxin
MRHHLDHIEGGGGSKTLYRPVIDPLASSGIERLRHVDLEIKIAKKCQKCQKNAKQIFDIKLCANLKY